MARYLSWPAVSQIWALIVLPSTCWRKHEKDQTTIWFRSFLTLLMVNKHLSINTWILLVANSTPMVDFDSKLNSLRVNLDKRLLLPTPESPISTTENSKWGDCQNSDLNMRFLCQNTCLLTLKTYFSEEKYWVQGHCLAMLSRRFVRRN